MYVKLSVVVLVALLAIAGWFLLNPAEQVGSSPPSAPETGAIVAVQRPTLEGLPAIGARAFAGKCAGCHGVDAGGLKAKGPPLIHELYKPGHHGDFAFERAARQGVRSHHWPFGDMPPVAGITGADIKAIIAYVRTLQKANGIF